MIESSSELVELYNPADIYAAFSEAAREAAGLPPEPTAEDDLLESAGIAPEETITFGEDPYAAAADSWAAGQPISLTEDDDESAARRLYDLALEYQERSQRNEARLLEDFESASAGLISMIGDLIIVDDDDERLTLTAGGTFRAEVIPEDSGETLADARRRRGAGRVLRPDRRLRRPRGRAGRGVPGRGAGCRADGAAGRTRTEAAGGDEAASGEPTADAGSRRGRTQRVTMRLAAAELVDSREILPGQWLQSYHAPDLAIGSRAGQFVHVRTGDFSGLVLRRPFSLNTADPATGIVTIHFRVVGPRHGMVHPPASR